MEKQRTIGKALRFIRKENGHTQKELAELIANKTGKPFDAGRVLRFEHSNSVPSEQAIEGLNKLYSVRLFITYQDIMDNHYNIEIAY